MAAAQGEGRIVHLKGQIPLDRNGEVVGEGNMRMVVGALSAQIEDLGGMCPDLLVIIAECACLGRAAPRSGNFVCRC